VLLAGLGVVGLRLARKHRHDLRVHWRRVRGRVRHHVGRWRGHVYRWTGRHPSDDVDDLTLADRVRSTLGPLEKSLDLPHVHVTVETGVVLLHGEVATEDERQAIEHRVSDIAGVEGVESYLHLGLLASDTRPSVGHRAPRPPSAARRALLDAAHRAGVNKVDAAEAVRATLSVFVQRLPEAERDHLLGHLPQDVRELAAPARRLGRSITRLRTVHELVLAVIGQDIKLPLGQADEAVEAVIGQLRVLVPGDAAHIRAVLPKELRDLWDCTGSVPAGNANEPSVDDRPWQDKAQS
jgi:uncharacterized protein (DUF2267 family)